MRETVTRYFKALLRLRRKRRDTSKAVTTGPIAGPLYDVLKHENKVDYDLSSLPSVYPETLTTLTPPPTVTPREIVPPPPPAPKLQQEDTLMNLDDVPNIPSETDCPVNQPGFVEAEPQHQALAPLPSFPHDLPLDMPSAIYQELNRKYDFDLPKTLATRHAEYRLLRQLGSGAHGTVLLAYDTRSQESVAVKVIRKQRLAFDDIPPTEDYDDVFRVSDVMLEISNLRLAKTVRSPFVTGLLGVCQDIDNCYIVMPLYAQSLSSRLEEIRASGEAMCLSTIRLYAAELVLALEAIHSYGLYHCDLKLDNIMIGLQGHISIVDFGLAESCSGVLRGRRGTLGYAAPEVDSGEFYSGAMADIYSLGVVLYCMALAPKNPFGSYGRITSTFEASPYADELDLNNLLPRLMYRDPEERIRMGQIKTHPFFSLTIWRKVADREYIPMYVPPFPGEPVKPQRRRQESQQPTERIIRKMEA